MTTGKIIKVYAPATVANVACGYDILGFAVEQPGDEVVAELNKSGKISIKVIHGSAKLPLATELNSASVAAQALLEHLKEKQGVAQNIGAELELFKKMPLGSGLGSSAASSAAGAFALNELMGQPLTRKELVPFAMQGEKIACGSAHADNVAPALMGGFVLIRSYNPLDVVSLPTTCNLFCALVHPHLEVRTEDARKILKRTITLEVATRQWGNVAGLVAGLTTGDLNLVGRSLEDLIVEPERALLIPGFDQVKATAISAGALGCSISGSGPSIFALSTSKMAAADIAKQMAATFSSLGIGCDQFVSSINTAGCKVCAD